MKPRRLQRPTIFSIVAASFSPVTRPVSPVTVSLHLSLVLFHPDFALFDHPFRPSGAVRAPDYARSIGRYWGEIAFAVSKLFAERRRVSVMSIIEVPVLPF